jgi:ribose transport system permease protein
MQEFLMSRQVGAAMGAVDGAHSRWSLLFALIEPRFFSVRNFARIGISSAPALMVAIGVTFIILMGSIDLSMEGTVAVSAVAFRLCLLALGGTAVGAGDAGACRWHSSSVWRDRFHQRPGLHVKLKIPSFMASLAMGFVGTGYCAAADRRRPGAHRGSEAFRMLLTVRIVRLSDHGAGLALALRC